MANYYEVLGLTIETATDEAVRAAYKRLALLYHPDRRGEEGHALMQMLKEAYDALKTHEGRQDYNTNMEFMLEAADEDPNFLRRPVRGFLEASGEAYSENFRRKYAELERQYRIKPLSTFAYNMRASHVYLTPLDTTFYSPFRDIYAFINDNTKPVSREEIKYMNERIQAFEQGSFHEQTAIQLFLEFLDGVFTSDALKRIVIILEEKKNLAAKADVYDIAYPLYEAMLAILTYQPGNGTSRSLAGLFPALKKISDYAQAAAKKDSGHYAILLQSSYFRHFYNCVVHDYWCATDNIFTQRHLNLFAGQDTAKQLLQNSVRQLNEVRSDSATTKILRETATVFRTLYHFEKDKEKARKKSKTPTALRELGFLILDWIPALTGKGHAIIANTFMQAAICFHRASQMESDPISQMADEHLASGLYSTAIELASFATPDIHLQIIMYGIKYMGKFRYQEEGLEHNLPIFQKRALLLAEVFPLVRNQQANVDWLVSDDSFLPLLRHYLHTLVDIIRNNNDDNQPFVIIDVDYLAALYQAYEACLKGWYKNSFEQNPEEQVRLLLMQEALARNGWTLNDLNKNLQAPMLERDNTGWLAPKESLPIKRDPNMQVFRSIDGLKIDFARGDIAFSVRPWSENKDPECLRVVTAADLMEIVYRNLRVAVLSLDPVDPYRFYYPFNTQRIVPPALFETQLHHAMLITDYWLKFLTVGSEAQGDIPYNQRPVAKMIAKLPKYLQKIITDFHQTQSKEGIHRFWIEALEADLAEQTTGEGLNKTAYFSFNNLRMVVKKHQMRRNVQGELEDITDTDENYEGWHFYVKNEQEINRKTLAEMKFPAIIFLGQTNEYILWEGGDDKSLPVYQLENYTHQLNQVFHFDRDAAGRVKVTPQNELFLYYITKKIARESEKPHHFTPEQIFAYEFTAHYDEFALYFPIFERLRQLSKMTIIVRILNGIKKNAEEQIVALQAKLDDTAHWQAQQRVINNTVQSIEQTLRNTEAEDYREKTTSITHMFNTIRADINQVTMRVQQKEKLRTLYNQLGTLNFSPYSSEINTIFEKNLQANRDSIIREYGTEAWFQAEYDIHNRLNNERSNWAHQLSIARRSSMGGQLREIFAPFFDSYSLEGKIEAFLRGETDDVATAIADNQFNKALDNIVSQICTHNPMWTTTEVRNAITSFQTPSYSDLIKKAVDYSLRNYRSSAQAEISTLRSLIDKAKAELRNEQAHFQKTKTSITTLGLGRDENNDEQEDDSPANTPLAESSIQQKYKLYLQLKEETLPQPKQLDKKYPLLLLNQEGTALKFLVDTPQGMREVLVPDKLTHELYPQLAKNIRLKSRAPLPHSLLPGTQALSFEHTQTTAPYSTDFARFSVPGDGNCFFYAVEHQLKRIRFEQDYTYHELRQLAVKHMLDHIDEYHHLVAQDFIRESIDQYFERMKKDNEWAGDPEIKALAEALGVCIQVMQPNQASRIYPEGGHPTIFLAYNGKYEGTGHYDSLIPTAELHANTAHVTAETVPDVELIERVIILNAESPVIAYLLAQGVTPALVAEQTKPTLPKRLQDQCLWVPASIAHTRNRFVYGGVSIMPQLNVLEAGTPRFNALYNQTFVNTSAGQTLVSASTFTAQASAFGGTPAAAGAGAPPTGGGGGGMGGSGKPPSGTPPTGEEKPPSGWFNRNAIKKDFQDHHIISDKNKAHYTHPVLQLANFNLQSRVNKIYLPTKEHLHPTRSLHSGKHTKEAIRTVTERLDEIFDKGQREGWNQLQYHDALIEMLKEMRTKLKAGNIPLNIRSRPWASFSS